MLFLQSILTGVHAKFPFFVASSYPSPKEKEAWKGNFSCTLNCLFTMKIRLIVISPTDSSYLREGISSYIARLKHYVSFEYLELPAVKRSKNYTSIEIKKREGEELLKQVDASSILILLDEKGKEYTSTDFSKFMQKQMNSGVKTIVFLVGGPFGFSENVYKRANNKLALSQMTFSHQMVRLFFVEQLYRAFTIIKGESYHHE